MPITPHQLEQRRKYIGSSDAPAICGVSPWSNPGKVFLEKLGKVEDAEVTEAQERGNFVEDSILNWFAAKTQKRIVRNQYRVSESGYQCANLDALCSDAIVEAKSGSDRDGWWGSIPDGIPEHVRIQCQHQMIVTDIKLAFIPALIVEFGRPVFRLYQQEWSNDLAEVVQELEYDFWHKHVLKEAPPPEVPPLEVLKRIRRMPNKSVLVADELVERWQASKAALSEMKKQAEADEAAVLAALGDAEEGRTNLGTLTYFETQRKGYTVEASTYRSLKLKTKKEK